MRKRIYDLISPQPPTIPRIIVAVVVVDQTEIGIVELAGPLDGLGYITFFRYLAVGGVGVGSADVAVLAVELADVLGEVPAVGVPGAVLLREHKAIHRHRFGGDVGGGNSTVLNTFRILTILRPLRGSQAAFADKNRFALQHGRQLRDELLLHSVGKLCSRRWGPEIRS